MTDTLQAVVPPYETGTVNPGIGEATANAQVGRIHLHVDSYTSYWENQTASFIFRWEPPDGWQQMRSTPVLTVNCVARGNDYTNRAKVYATYVVRSYGPAGEFSGVKVDHLAPIIWPERSLPVNEDFDDTPGSPYAFAQTPVFTVDPYTTSFRAEFTVRSSAYRCRITTDAIVSFVSLQRY